MFRIAVVGGRPAPIAGAKELGIDVVLVHEPGKYHPSIAAHCEQIVHASVEDSAAILEVLRPLHAKRPFDRVMTTAEIAAVSTGQVVDALGLPGVGEATALALKDKSLTRRRLDEHGLSPVRFAVLETAEQAAEFYEKVGGRIVIKPIDGAASLRINLVDSAAAAAEVFTSLLAEGVLHPIAEEYLDGPVVSVDSISYGGRHVPIGYSEYRMNDRFVEWEVSTPSRVALPYLQQLRSLTPQLLDAVGLTEGPSHSEFVLTESGPRVLESHARLAGSGAPELVRRAFGYDLNRMMMTVPLQIDPLPASSPEPIAGAAVRFFTPAAGKIERIDIAEDIQAIVRRLPAGVTPDVFLPFLDEFRELEIAAAVTKNVGDAVPPLLTVADCVSGYVIATGADREDAVRRCDEVNDKIRIETS